MYIYSSATPVKFKYNGVVVIYSQGDIIDPQYVDYLLRYYSGRIKTADGRTVLNPTTPTVTPSSLYASDASIVAYSLETEPRITNVKQALDDIYTTTLTGYQCPLGPTGPSGGPIGPTGYQGFQGVSGSIGPRGLLGYQGVTGAIGPSGNVGPTGATGHQGYQGNIGLRGLMGPTGPSGGPQGPQGFQGAPGSGSGSVTGIQGPQGYQGFQGISGSNGLTGSQGSQGDRGYQGETGDRGLTGNQGYLGETGPTGPQGFQGISGSDGSTGSQGNPGVAGAQGYLGETGPTGPQGFQGIIGEVGPSGINGSNGSTGPQGYQGTPGSSGVTAIRLTVTAGETLNQYSPFIISSNGLAYNAYNSSNQKLADSLGIIIEDGGIPSGASGLATLNEIITDSNWGFTPGETVYVSYIGGRFVQNKPSSGYVKPIGRALSASNLYINPQNISITNSYVSFTNIYSISLDGSNDYVSVPDDSSLNFGLNNFSVSSWFKASSSGTNIIQGIVGKIWDNANSSGNPGWSICLNSSGQLFVALGDSTNPNTVDNLTYLLGYADYRDDLWHNIIISIDRTSNLLNMYFDGSFKKSFDISVWTNTFDSTYPLIMGGNYRKGNIDGNFKGSLDEIALFNVDLSLQDVREVYGNGLASNLIDFSSLVAWYRMGD